MIDLIVSLAKHNNKHSVCDKYMRVFARHLMETNNLMAKRLEVLLNTEIAIKKPEVAAVETTADSVPLHPNILAQGEFPYLAVG